MILNYYRRVVFWGCKVDRNLLRVELGYFGSHLTTNRIKLKLKNEWYCTIELPQEFLKQFKERRITNLSFNILEKSPHI